ncbi:MAG: hypothetical protein R3F48_12350 [Candidatus Zixiibacteriota bacterium]
MHRFKTLSLAFSVLLLFLITTLAFAGKDTPQSSSAGPASLDPGPRPVGKIAFINDGNVWMCDTDGSDRHIVCEIKNAKGPLSFSPDNKRIAFSRFGSDQNQLPSGEGGRHLLHDLFIAFVDSATTNQLWWNRVTYGLGGAFATWSDNDSVLYYQNDINAGFVDYIVPSFQLAKVSVSDGHAEYLRKDWQSISTNFLMPSFTRDGNKVAYVISYSVQEDKYSFQNFGVKIVAMKDIMLPESEMRKPTKGLEKAISPSWSPDGQWLAYLNNDMRNPGIYIMKADLTENRLVYAPGVAQQLSPSPVSWAPNSKWITFAMADGTIYTIDIAGNNLKQVTGPGPHNSPAWSN